MDCYSGGYEEEVELIDILRVIWKWRFFLVFCLFFLVASALIVCLNLEKVYKITMTIQPGVIISNGGEKRELIDPIETIAGRIGAGIYNDEVFDSVISSGMAEARGEIKFNVEIPKQSDVVLVSFENPDANLGVLVLEELFFQIKNQEKQLVDQFIDHYDRRISLARIELQKQRDFDKSYETNIRNLDVQIQAARSDIAMINRNNISLTQEKKLLERKTDNERALTILLFNNTIQQNNQYVNSAKKELSEHVILKEGEHQKIIQSKNEQKRINEEIFAFEKQKNSIRPMAMLRKPIPSREPVKPKKILIFALTLFFGFLISLVMIFFIEYIRNSLDISTTDMVVKEMGKL